MPAPPPNAALHPHNEKGNIFIIIFIAIVLIAALTVAVRGTSSGRDSISKEDLKIQASATIRYGAELENAVRQVLENGASENDIRFAHPDAAVDYGVITTTPSYQIFSQNGGRAAYRLAAPSVMASGTEGTWEFYGTTNIPQVGSARAELIAVLPDITAAFCGQINKELGLTGQPDDDTTGTVPDCVQGTALYRFGAAAGFSSPANNLDSATFSTLPATSACVTCGVDYHYYHVLLAR